MSEVDLSRDWLLAALMTVVFLTLTFHIWLTVRQLVTYRWNVRRLKGNVTRGQIWGAWILLGSLVLLLIGLVALVVALKTQ